jgi:hypothetical protein
LTADKTGRGTYARLIVKTCHIQWDDLAYENKRVLIRDMKHPIEKENNHKGLHLPTRAWAIVISQPKDTDFIFPL